MTDKYYRQGDVLFVRVANIPSKLQSTKHTELTVQHGEATGHHHTLYPISAGIIATDEISESAPANCLDLYTKNNERFVHLDTAWLLRHQEHKELRIEPGVYEIRIEEEYDPFERLIRKVID